jgi:deoxycytidylate deaminase
LKDCTTLIINSGVKNVVYAAPDPEYSPEAKRRFHEAGVNYRMVEDKEITTTAIEIFNNTITDPITFMGTPRAKRLP